MELLVYGTACIWLRLLPQRRCLPGRGVLLRPGIRVPSAEPLGRCIFFFYSDVIPSSDALRFFTDAAPSVGFGGLFQVQWFAGPWPDAFPQSISSALPITFQCHPPLLRIGAATRAASLGLPYSALQQLGRWSSSALSSYIRPDTSTILAAQRLFASP
uniref:Tyr recombinase domain-containing protein n=1 Tax=Knipowitschia caucasica TaxID=637954 RepID=A0AAV2KUX9_KNICA